MSTSEAPMRPVLGSTPALVFATLSVPLAFMGHLVSLSAVLAALAIMLSLFGRWLNARRPGKYSSSSLTRLTWSLRIGSLGLLFSVGFWILWATGTLPLLP
ncbi:MAG: hypothetical protein WEC15_06845 [Flavobacteriales bacterium]